MLDFFWRTNSDYGCLNQTKFLKFLLLNNRLMKNHYKDSSSEIDNLSSRFAHNQQFLLIHFSCPLENLIFFNFLQSAEECLNESHQDMQD